MCCQANHLYGSTFRILQSLYNMRSSWPPTWINKLNAIVLHKTPLSKAFFVNLCLRRLLFLFDNRMFILTWVRKLEPSHWRVHVHTNGISSEDLTATQLCIGPLLVTSKLIRINLNFHSFVYSYAILWTVVIYACIFNVNLNQTRLNISSITCICIPLVQVLFVKEPFSFRYLYVYW